MLMIFSLSDPHTQSPSEVPPTKGRAKEHCEPHCRENTPTKSSSSSKSKENALQTQTEHCMRELSRPEKGTLITLGGSCDPGDESTSVAAGIAGFSKALRVWQAPTGGGRWEW